jgi:hypothetical protein
MSIEPAGHEIGEEPVESAPPAVLRPARRLALAPQLLQEAGMRGSSAALLASVGDRRAELAVNVARGAGETGGLSAAGAAMGGWTEKHARTCFSVHRSLWLMLSEPHLGPDLELRPEWSPLHRSVTRASSAELAAGATFDQQLSLGLPAGTTSKHVTIDLLEPARRASCSGDCNGIKSCHLWSFTPLPDGGTHVSNVEVFASLTVAMLRPLVARRWNLQFQAAVDGLIGAAG